MKAFAAPSRRAEPRASGLPPKASPARSPAAVRQILHGARVQRSPDDAVLEESERMRDQTRRQIREGLRREVDDLRQFPFTTKDPDRGFRPQDLAQLDKAGVSLTFAGSLSPLPADAEKRCSKPAGTLGVSPGSSLACISSSHSGHIRRTTPSPSVSSRQWEHIRCTPGSVIPSIIPSVIRITWPAT